MPMLKARKKLGASVNEMCCIAIMKFDIKRHTTRTYLRTQIFERFIRILTLQFHIFMIRSMPLLPYMFTTPSVTAVDRTPTVLSP